VCYAGEQLLSKAIHVKMKRDWVGL
jgi:hypothetical protein